MATVNSFGVRNLRSFGSKHQLVPIKKINIFVGKNSCGKSTFLRTYPLLRQSVESNTRSPILWYGSYVDFGNITTALNDGSDEIHFDFDVLLDIESKNNEKFVLDGSFISELDFTRPNEFSKFNVLLSIGLRPLKDKRVQSTTYIKIKDIEINVNYIGNHVEALSFKLLDEKNPDTPPREHSFNEMFLMGKSSLLPLKIMGTKEIKEDNKNYRVIVKDYLSDIATKELTSFLRPYCTTAGKTLSSKIENLSLCSIDEFKNQLKKALKNDKKFGESYSKNAEEITKVAFFYTALKQVDDILHAADKSLKDLFSGVRYLGPVRASAERFYRHQDLEIGEIDHKGENLPMVINSLDARMKKQLSSWISENFGFELDLETSGLHYELKIKEDQDSKFHNISDMGFGYSQILPVIVSIWLEIQSKRSRNHSPFLAKSSRTLVIEQPELHLHPALQYQFGVAIAKVCKLASSQDFKIVMETHSSQLIEALGESIRNGTISDKDVNITLFEKNSADCTEVTQSGFDSEGYLLNWPTGFLSA